MPEPLTLSSKVVLFGIPVDNLTMDETVRRVEKAVSEKKPLHHIAVNAGKIVAMQNNPSLRADVLSADIINADGMAVVWASRLLGKPLKERVAGIDLMHALLDLAARKHFKVYLFGATEEVVKRTVKKIEDLYGSHIIAGYRNGYFTDAEASAIARDIASSGADMLFVAISSPKKERFLNAHKKILSKVPFVMGVGGSFDVLAGKVKRAPRWMQRWGLEWFYRLIQEPRRMWRRYLIGNARFLNLLWKEWRQTRNRGRGNNR